MLRKTLAIVLGALAIPAVAQAAGTSKAAPKVTYMLKGTLSRYSAASAAADGSITIHVSDANYHARFLRGRDFTFAITTKTVIRLNGNSTIGNGSRGVVKFRAPKKMTNAALMTALRPDHMRARQVIDQGRFQPG
jgi:hypothetical protein